MEQLPSSLGPFSDRDVVAAVARLARSERAATANLVAALAELDARRLYLGEGFPSLFAYCTDHLHFSKHEAYHRIEAARAAREYPIVVEWLRDASLSLSAVSLLRPHLTTENDRGLLEAARHQPTRIVEELVARVAPRPDTRTLVRRLPSASAARAASSACESPVTSRQPASAVGLQASGRNGSVGAAQPVIDAGSLVDEELVRGSGPVEHSVVREPTASPRAAVIRPLAPARYHLQMTISAETHAKLRRAQDLLRRALPSTDAAAVVDRALTVLLQHLERTRCAATTRRARQTKRAPSPANGQAKGTERSEPAVQTAPREATGEDKRQQTGEEKREPAAAAGNDAPGGDERNGVRLDAAALGRLAVGRTPVGGSARDVEAGNAVRHGSRPMRYVPAAVKRAVWTRDEGRCAYIGAAGRCPERAFLELHHKEAFARGGEATAANLELRCRAHNRHEADRAFGRAFMTRRVIESRESAGGRERGQAAAGRSCESVQTRCAPSLYPCEPSP